MMFLNFFKYCLIKKMIIFFNNSLNNNIINLVNNIFFKETWNHIRGKLIFSIIKKKLLNLFYNVRSKYKIISLSI